MSTIIPEVNDFHFAHIFLIVGKDLDETNMQLMNELKEQRQHVDMLDAALSKAQADVARLQEEVNHNSQ